MRCAALLAAALLVAAPPARAADSERVELRAHATIQDLRLADLNGDGLGDVLVAEGRRLQAWFGRRDRLPPAAPDWQRQLPEWASFVDVLPAAGDRPPGLLVLGTQGAGRLALDPAAPLEPLPHGDPLDWRDAEKVTLARLVRPDGGLLLPRRGGWTYVPAGGVRPIRIDAPLARSVSAPGPFLEDTCEVVADLPAIYVGRPAQLSAPEGAIALWILSQRALRAHAEAGDVVYDLGFLRSQDAQQDIEQRLVDLDRDGRPELVHRIANNREARYGFFRTNPSAHAGDRGPTHQPAASDVYLSGFPLPPEIVDLDGDGLEDLVATSIQIDAANTLRALSTGKVTAETHAFLNRWNEGRGRYFREEADATVESDIGVKVRISYAGTIEVERSYTILVAGDFNGDGRKDLAIRTDDDTLTIRRGTADGVWEEHGREIAIPALGAHPDLDGYTADLDGDGRDELVLSYSRPPGGRDRLWILRVEP